MTRLVITRKRQHALVKINRVGFTFWRECIVVGAQVTTRRLGTPKQRFVNSKEGIGV